jgi:hypothetical protein
MLTDLRARALKLSTGLGWFRADAWLRAASSNVDAIEPEDDCDGSSDDREAGSPTNHFVYSCSPVNGEKFDYIQRLRLACRQLIATSTEGRFRGRRPR